MRGSPVLLLVAVTFTSFERNLKMHHRGQFTLFSSSSLNISCEHQWKPVKNAFENVHTPLASATNFWGFYSVVLTDTQLSSLPAVLTNHLFLPCSSKGETVYLLSLSLEGFLSL